MTQREGSVITRARRFLRLPPSPKLYRQERIVSPELAAVSVAAGLADELVRIELELTVYRQQCRCGTATDARLVRGALR